VLIGQTEKQGQHHEKERPMHKAKILNPAIRPDCGRRNDAIK
jgi:hypothetical protein